MSREANQHPPPPLDGGGGYAENSLLEKFFRFQKNL